MKLVVKDLYKIRKSYEKHLEIKNSIENSNISNQSKKEVNGNNIFQIINKIFITSKYHSHRK